MYKAYIKFKEENKDNQDINIEKIKCLAANRSNK